MKENEEKFLRAVTKMCSVYRSAWADFWAAHSVKWLGRACSARSVEIQFDSKRVSTQKVAQFIQMSLK